MGASEQAHYRDDLPYGEADVLARKILRGGTKIMRDCYRWRGQTYWVVYGRVLTREQAAALEIERRQEGRIPR